LRSRTNQRLTHNDRPGSGFAQAGSDMVVMRRQVQTPNLKTPNRGITKVIMRKDHNQPVGSVQLLFERSLVRLRDLDKSPKRPSS